MEAQFIPRSMVVDVLINNTALAGCDLEKAVNAVRAIPAADVLPVVRCRDCTLSRRYTNKIKCGRSLEIVDDDDFVLMVKW